MNDDKITYAFPKQKNVDPSCYIDAYTLVLECSRANSPRSFAITLLNLMDRVCSFDQAIVLFFDINRKVSGWYSIGIKDEWISKYLSMYLNMTDYPKEISIYQNVKENSNFDFSRIIDWGTFPKSEFITDYINMRGIKYSWGFCFFDINGTYRAIISLDRTRNSIFSEIERNRLELALPILNNIHRIFFYHGLDTDDHIIQSPWKEYDLTSRESEIANNVCCTKRRSIRLSRAHA